MACAEALCVAGVPVMSLRDHSKAIAKRCEEYLCQQIKRSEEQKIKMVSSFPVQVDLHGPVLAAGPKPASEDESGHFHLHAATCETGRKPRERLHDAGQPGFAGAVGPTAGGMLGYSWNAGGAAV